MNNRHKYIPFTKEGGKLDLTQEEEHGCKVVYRKTEDVGIYNFYDLWNPERDYTDEFVILPLRSTYDGTVKYGENQIFANIIGSNEDPNHSASSWISLFSKADPSIPCDTCVTDGKFYNPINGESYSKTKNGSDCECSPSMVGGHILLNQKDAAKANPGDTVYLIPICKHHNSYVCGNGSGNGTGFYMKSKNSGYCIKLKNYLRLD